MDGLAYTEARPSGEDRGKNVPRTGERGIIMR